MVIIEVCVGSACHLKGAYNVINDLQKIINERNLSNKVEVKAAFCLGNCTKPVSVKINDESVLSVQQDNVEEFFDKNVAWRL